MDFLPGHTPPLGSGRVALILCAGSRLAKSAGKVPLPKVSIAVISSYISYTGVS